MYPKMTVVRTSGRRERYETDSEMTFGLHMGDGDRKIVLPVPHHHGAEYVRDYNRGWAASSRPGVSDEWDSGTGSVAFDDGYMDRAAGREKWHLAWCDVHGTDPCVSCGRA